jgi:transposase-like protein
MKRKRRSFTPEFKARLALEAAREIKTISEIAAENDVHPNQVSAWKKELLEGAGEVFAKGKSAREDAERAEREKSRLERKIGQLTVEVDWLKKKSEELGL